jgi:hypothetical protein
MNSNKEATTPVINYVLFPKAFEKSISSHSQADDDDDDDAFDSFLSYTANIIIANSFTTGFCFA